MAFIPSNMYRISLPPPQQNVSSNAAPLYAFPSTYGYNSGLDDLATVSASGYFTPFANFNFDQQIQLNVGDLIYCVCSDVNTTLSVVTNTNPYTTEVTPITGSSVVTSSIADGAVTAPKIADAAITTTQISASAGILGSQLAASAGIVGTQLSASAAIAGTQLAANTLSDTEILANGISAASLALSVPQVIRVPITSANFKTAYTAGLACIPAAGSGTIIVVDSVTYSFDFLTAAYTSGGAIGLQYSASAPANAGGFAASATVAAATLTALSATGYITTAGALAIASAAQAVDVGVWLTVASNNFATGAGAVVVNIQYHVVTV